MIQIAGIAAVCLLLTVLLRKENPTFALLVTVAGAGLLFYTVSKLAGSAFGILGDLISCSRSWALPSLPRWCAMCAGTTARPH